MVEGHLHDVITLIIFFTLVATVIATGGRSRKPPRGEQRDELSPACTRSIASPALGGVAPAGSPLNNSLSSRIDYFGTVRGRVSYSWDRTLVYCPRRFELQVRRNGLVRLTAKRLLTPKARSCDRAFSW